ncbi:MAG TPA: alpha/beta fold hydrolase [Chitinophagaceae bacterium]
MQDLLLLHGAIGAKDQLDGLAEALRPFYKIHTINFPGHGGEPLSKDFFSIPGFATTVRDYLQTHAISTSHIFGYSMGGYVGMYIAKNYPAEVGKLVTLATKYYWDVEVAAKEIKMLNPATIMQKVPAFAQQLQKRHGTEAWVTLLDKTKELLLGLGNDNLLQPQDYSTISTECLLMLGDRDKMVTLEETLSTYQRLMNAQFSVLPATAHPIEQVDIDLIVFQVRRFLG